MGEEQQVRKGNVAVEQDGRTQYKKIIEGQESVSWKIESNGH